MAGGLLYRYAIKNSWVYHFFRYNQLSYFDYTYLHTNTFAKPSKKPEFSKKIYALTYRVTSSSGTITHP